ncbi:MAG: polysaccharide deacetylase family protein [Alphaproteobacteria bacterium]
MKPGAYGPFPYSAIIDRPQLSWPGGARVAVWVNVNLEFFPYNEKVPQTAGHVPDVPGWSRTDYGNRVGVFRVMEAMARHGVPGTAALNAEVCDHHPRIVARAKELGWGVIGHCQSNSRPLNEVPPETEREVIRATLDTIERTWGARPTGWLGASMAESADTLEHLAALGISYTADWLNDDQPFLLDVARPSGGRMVALPFGQETHDKGNFQRRAMTPTGYAEMLKRTFDVLYREGGRVMPIALHPFVIGVPHRIGALDEALAYIRGHDGAWCATADEIVDAYLAQNPTV